MKKFITFLLTVFIILPVMAQTRVQVTASEHGGGNGGDDLELELKKRSLQISYFLNSTVGKSTFKMINAEAVIETVNKIDIDVVTHDVIDKYGNIRTCINEEMRSLITCNFKRINDLVANKKSDILTAILFHEILGIMGIELGYMENPSLYPISSKIIPYTAIVESTPVSEASIRPEFYGLDNRSYGVTLINKKSGETLRLICLNDNIEVHRCRNFNIVRKFDKIQSPLVPEIAALNWDDVKSIPIKAYYRKVNKALSALLNQKQELTLIGTSAKIKDWVFQDVINYLKQNLKTTSQRIKETEELRIKQEEERKDSEDIDQIGNYSVKFIKDVVILANSQSIKTYTRSDYPYYGYHVQIQCYIQSSNKENFDRAIPAGAVFSYEVGESMRPTSEDDLKAGVVLKGKISQEGLQLLLRCTTSDPMRMKITIGEFKSFYAEYFNVILEKPKKIEEKNENK